jgi:proline racemase
VTSGAVFPSTIRVVDSHTEGEPTRVVIDGWPQPAGRTMAERLAYMRARQDHLRSAVVCEPRGHDAVVGVLLVPPVEQGSVAGVVFFNNGTWLGMCGHGLIGVVRTLQHLGRLAPGAACFDTPVGTVSVELAKDGTVTITNVPAHVHAREVNVSVPGYGLVTGDIAWGGNWFFLAELATVPLVFERRTDLLRVTTAIRSALAGAGITGSGGAMIDHVELFAPPTRTDADSRNFVLCPGSAYDRSPCGTGTSAKMAVMHARGQLAIGERWHQESIVGSMFTGWLEADGAALVPYIQGRAFITSRTTLLFDAQDPFRHGLA